MPAKAPRFGAARRRARTARQSPTSYDDFAQEGNPDDVFGCADMPAAEWPAWTDLPYEQVIAVVLDTPAHVDTLCCDGGEA